MAFPLAFCWLTVGLLRLSCVKLPCAVPKHSLPRCQAQVEVSSHFRPPWLPPTVGLVRPNRISYEKPCLVFGPTTYSTYSSIQHVYSVLHMYRVPFLCLVSLGLPVAIISLCLYYLRFRTRGSHQVQAETPRHTHRAETLAHAFIASLLPTRGRQETTTNLPSQATGSTKFTKPVGFYPPLANRDRRCHIASSHPLCAGARYILVGQGIHSRSHARSPVHVVCVCVCSDLPCG